MKEIDSLTSCESHSFFLNCSPIDIYIFEHFQLCHSNLSPIPFFFTMEDLMPVFDIESGVRHYCHSHPHKEERPQTKKVDFIQMGEAILEKKGFEKHLFKKFCFLYKNSECG